MDRTPADRPEHPGASDRFNEDKATYTVRGGGDTPDLDAGVAAIRNVVKTLPVRPGVYRMQDSRGDVLYVGKAKALPVYDSTALHACAAVDWMLAEEEEARAAA